MALDAASKSMVVYGPNGAGKSSFVDAMEYAIQDGKLAHLTHEYSGRNQEKAIVNTHTPVGKSTGFEITFEDDSKLEMKIARNGTHVTSGLGAEAIRAWEYRRTILRQDEVAEFIRSRKGEKYSALLPLFGLHELEVGAENLRQLMRTIERKAALTYKQGTLNQTRAKRTQVFSADSDEKIDLAIGTLHSKYCSVVPASNALDRCNDLEEAIAQRIGLLTLENQRHLALTSIGNVNLAGALHAVQNANTKLAVSVEPLIKEKLEVLHSVTAFATAIACEGEGEGEVACPACGRSISVSEFKAHIKSERERLSGIIVSFEERRAAITVFIDVVKGIKATFARTEIAAWRDMLKRESLGSNANWLDQYIPEALRDSLTEADLATIEENCIPITSSAKAASLYAPPDVKEISHDKTLIETAKAVFEAKELEEELSKTQQLITFLEAVETGVRDEIRSRSAAVITDISTDIGTMWKTLHPHEPIEDVRLYLPEDDKAIDIALKFCNCSPRSGG